MGSRERIQREKEQRREAILRAAEKLFLKKGFENTTMDEIARRCDLSKGTLYLYFSTKEQLYLVIINRAVTEMLDLVKEMQADVESPLDRLRNIGEAYLRFYETHPDHFSILIRVPDQMHHKSMTRAEVRQIFEKNMELWTIITGIITDGMQKNVFRKDTNPVEIAISLFATSTMIIKLMDHHARNRHDQDDPTFFKGLDFVQLYKSIGRRTIVSIMENPPENPPENPAG
ncbi:MAG: TetR/AcrR family transcriptional regulator [Spirochaetes bacterium]|nr:TetR/AcrR family transcriptional regulator [Spirochaetota bacterium]